MRSGLALAAATLICLVTPAIAAPRLYPALSDIEWRADDGAPLSLADLKGRIVIMTMGYSGCRKTCSTSVLVLKELQALLDRSGKQAAFVVVTYDPDNDTPQTWRQYRRARGLTRPNWYFLSASAGATRRVARFLDLDYWAMDDHIIHDFRIVIFDQEGRWRREIVWQTQKDLDHLFDDL